MENLKETKTPKSKGKILAIIGIVIILVLGAVAVNWYIDQKNYVSTDNAKVSGDILNASSKIPGKVATISAVEGNKVKKGDILFTLETDQAQDQVNQAQAALDVVKAQLDKAAGGARSQDVAGAQAMYDQAQAGYNGAKAGRDALQVSINDAQSKYNDLISSMSSFKNPSTGELDAGYAMSSLDNALKAKAITDAQYTVKSQAIQQMFASKAQLEGQLDQLKGQLKSLNAQVDAAKAGVDGANSKLSLVNAGASDKDIAILQNQVKAAQAALDLAKLNLDNTTVKAPADGTIVQVNVHAGDTIGAGQAAVVIADLSKLQVTANVLENDLNRINLNQKVTLTIDAFPGIKFTGTVKEKGLATASVFNMFDTSSASGNYTKVSQRVPIKIDFDLQGKPVIPGMSSEVKIKVTQ